MEPNLKNAGRSPATTPDILRLEAMLGDMPLAPGERFYAKMRRAPWAQVPRPDAACARRHASRRLAFGVAAALATVALVAATPQGRALAQTVVQFFTRLQTDTREISSEAAPQPLPYQEECGSVIHPRCSVAEIRERVGFSVVELGTPPEGMSFEGATGGPERAMLVYRGERGSIILVQSPAGLDDAGVWAVGAGANVETVTIGATSGEYVAGLWGGEALADDAQVAWEDWPATQTLRWEQGGVRYTIAFTAAKSGNGPVFGREDLIALAEDLTSEAVASAPAFPAASSIRQVASEAGFPPTEPAWLPSGYSFDHAAYSAEHRAVCLSYRYLDLERWTFLTVAQAETSDIPAFEELRLQALHNGRPVEAAVERQTVEIGGATGGRGELAITGVDTSRLCGGETEPANMSLFWESNGRGYAMFASLDQYDGRGFLTTMEMQRVAESLTGVSTIPAEAVDPGRLPSPEAAEELAGFGVRAPRRLPQGISFSYAAYRAAAGEDGAPEVFLLYFASTRDSIGRSHGYLISQTTGSPNTLEEVALGGGYEWLSVRGQPAVYRQMCWDATAEGLDASCTLELSWFEAGIRFDIFGNLPGAEVGREALLAMAESMQ